MIYENHVGLYAQLCRQSVSKLLLRRSRASKSHTAMNFLSLQILIFISLLNSNFHSSHLDCVFALDFNTHLLRNIAFVRINNVNPALPVQHELGAMADRAFVALNKQLALPARFLFAHFYFSFLVFFSFLSSFSATATGALAAQSSLPIPGW